MSEDAKRQAMLAAEARRLGIPEWKLEMSRAVGTDLIQDIVRDNRTTPSGPSSMLGTAVDRGTGWLAEKPLRQPEGIEWVDRLMDAQDARDRKERERERKT